jgi:Holliday junction resolvase RusA-like endonuclease
MVVHRIEFRYVDEPDIRGDRVTFSASFTIPGCPVAKGRARSVIRRSGNRSFIGNYTPSKTRQAEATLAARVMEFRPAVPVSEALRLAVVFYLPIPQSWSQKKTSAALSRVLPHVSSPDLDNLVKLVNDALNGVFWIDDRQIIALHAQKFYSDNPRTVVEIWEV